jgi:hypothetical protein
MECRQIFFRSFTHRWLTVMSLVVSPQALAAPLTSGQALLSLPAVTASSRNLPGSFRETNIFTEQSLSLNSRLSWETSTGLTTTQYAQTIPLRSQSARLTTGPRLQLGRFELSVPIQSGQELGSGQSDVMWRSNAPRMSFALGPDDKIWLEARLQNRTEHRQVSSRKSRKSLGINWRHAFDETYSLRTGLGRNQEIMDDGLQRSQGAEVYAQLNMHLPDRWQLSLLGSLQRLAYPSQSLVSRVTRDQSASLALSASHGLGGGWWVSGSYAIDQNAASGLSVPVYTQSGRLRLTRDF